MRLVTWNCQGGIFRKWSELASLEPSIAVVQEVREKELRDLGASQGLSTVWKGDKGKKGLGVIGLKKWVLNQQAMKIRPRHLLPFIATKGKKSIRALAVWAMPAKAPGENSYIGQVFNALTDLGPSVSDFQIIIGDFNANKIWDHKRVLRNFSAVAERLKKQDLQSAYHTFHKQSFGRERVPTFFLYRHKSKTYHIDYCFLNSILRRRIKSVKIGKFQTWSKFSDHSPLIVDI